MAWLTLNAAVIGSFAVMVGLFFLVRFTSDHPRHGLLRTAFTASIGLFLGLCLAWIIRELMTVNIAALYMQWYFRFTYGS